MSSWVERFDEKFGPQVVSLGCANEELQIYGVDIKKRNISLDDIKTFIQGESEHYYNMGFNNALTEMKIAILNTVNSIKYKAYSQKGSE